MENAHQFLFTPGVWIGEGRIVFSSSPELIRFYTKWVIDDPMDEKVLTSRQLVEIQGAQENILNNFTVTDANSERFKIKLENDLVGEINGTGVIDPKTVAWEFRGHESFEGFEVCELQDNGDYMVHAEYASLDQHRTTIDGRIWKKG